MVDVRSQRFRRVRAGLADPRRGVRDKGCDGSGLDVDARADLLERIGRAVENGVERSGVGGFGVADARRRGRTGMLDLGKPGRETFSGLGNDLLGAFSMLREVVHLAA